MALSLVEVGTVPLHVLGVIRADVNIGPDIVASQSPGPTLGLITMRRDVLPFRAVSIQGAAEAHAIFKILRLLTVQQLINSGRGQLYRSHCVVTLRAGVQLRRSTSTVVVLGPTVTAATNQNPTAAVSLLVAVELLWSRHRRGVQPVLTGFCILVDLFSFITGSGCLVAGGAVVNDRILSSVGYGTYRG